MATLHKLTANEIKGASPGKYSDGGGLWFHRREDGGAQWFLRVTIHGRRREMGLGSATEVSLKEAREHAKRWREVVRNGKDPIKERERLAREAARKNNSLRQVAEEAFEARKAQLKDDGKAGRWFTPLALHVLPKLGRTPIEEIDQRDIRDTLQPIWHTKADTARKAMNRLNIVFKHGAALGLDVDIQAVEKAKALLGRTRHKPTHIPAMPWQEVPEFYSTLSDGSVTHLALRLLILTAVRSRPLRCFRIEQILDDDWTIPAENMKALKGKEAAFRVPLSEEAMNVIDAARAHEKGGFLFPSVRKGVISDATMARFMERAGLAARPHGFRSSFRDWAAETTDVPREVVETALGHVAGGQVERAYRRTDYLERRRVLLERWASLVTGQKTCVLSIVRDDEVRQP